jgi:hypothetical protein
MSSGPGACSCGPAGAPASALPAAPAGAAAGAGGAGAGSLGAGAAACAGGRAGSATASSPPPPPPPPRGASSPAGAPVATSCAAGGALASAAGLPRSGTGGPCATLAALPFPWCLPRCLRCAEGAVARGAWWWAAGLRLRGTAPVAASRGPRAPREQPLAGPTAHGMRNMGRGGGGAPRGAGLRPRARGCARATGLAVSAVSGARRAVRAFVAARAAATRSIGTTFVLWSPDTPLPSRGPSRPRCPHPAGGHGAVPDSGAPGGLPGCGGAGCGRRGGARGPGRAASGDGARCWDGAARRARGDRGGALRRRGLRPHY